MWTALNMKIILLTSLLALTIKVAVSATCTYDQSSNKISCRRVTCNTIGQVQGGKLPVGYYRIGTFYTSMAVPGPPGSIFTPKDQQKVTGIITPKYQKLVAEVALDFTHARNWMYNSD